jgi:hypothetical protein
VGELIRLANHESVEGKSGIERDGHLGLRRRTYRLSSSRMNWTLTLSSPVIGAFGNREPVPRASRP